MNYALVAIDYLVQHLAVESKEEAKAHTIEYFERFRSGFFGDEEWGFLLQTIDNIVGVAR